MQLRRSLRKLDIRLKQSQRLEEDIWGWLTQLLFTKELLSCFAIHASLILLIENTGWLSCFLPCGQTGGNKQCCNKNTFLPTHLSECQFQEQRNLMHALSTQISMLQYFKSDFVMTKNKMLSQTSHSYLRDGVASGLGALPWEVDPITFDLSWLCIGRKLSVLGWKRLLSNESCCLIFLYTFSQAAWNQRISLSTFLGNLCAITIVCLSSSQNMRIIIMIEKLHSFLKTFTENCTLHETFDQIIL